MSSTRGGQPVIKLLWRSDVHLADQGPSSRKDDWVDSVFAKLAQVKAVAKKAQVDAVLDGGDFFHIKSPSRNSHRLVRVVADHHLDYPCPVYCTPGNHDCVHGDYSYLEQQPLGVLYSSGVFQRLYDEYEATFPSPEQVAIGASMGAKPEVTVRVVGVPYHGREYDMERIRAIHKGDEDYLVVVAHLLASREGGTMFEREDVLKYADLAPLDPDLWLFGHWHKDQGVATIGGKKFVNLGSVTRGSLTQDDIDRRPAIALLTFDRDGIQVKTARLKVKPVDEVFDLESKARAETREMTIEAFVSSVKETLVDSTGAPLEDTVRGMDNIPSTIRDRALTYLEQVE
jgi:DNA repair protein SbcD/Mre11